MRCSNQCLLHSVSCQRCQPFPFRPPFLPVYLHLPKNLRTNQSASNGAMHGVCSVPMRAPSRVLGTGSDERVVAYDNKSLTAAPAVSRFRRDSTDRIGQKTTLKGHGKESFPLRRGWHNHHRCAYICTGASDSAAREGQYSIVSDLSTTSISEEVSLQNYAEAF